MGLRGIKGKPGDYTGQRFGKLLAVERVGKNKYGTYLWLCLCDCGKTVIRPSGNLNKRQKSSCGPGCRTAPNQLPSGIASFNSLYGHYKQDARIRKLSFNLPKGIFRNLTSGVCFYCGIGPTKIKKGHKCNGSYIYNGIDRIDNNVGYEPGNCVPCCEWCNRMKLDHSMPNFLFHISQIYKTRAECIR